MEVTVEQVVKHLKFNDAPKKKVTIGSEDYEKEPNLYAVEYIFDIAPYNDKLSDTISDQFKKMHKFIEGKDGFLAYALDNLNDAVTLLESFITNVGLEIDNSKIERIIRVNHSFKNSMVLLLLIERPYFE